jgi:hypothetical protein
MRLTRRSLLRTGMTAGAAVAIGIRPWAAAAATGPGYLTRSAYAGLEGTSFTVETGAEPVVLRLESVSDVAGAAARRALVGSDDAFALTFSGPLATPLDSGIHTLHHPRIGSFELFASPVDAPDANRSYEVVVDRSIGMASAHADAPASPPAPPAESLSEPSHGADPDPPAATLVRRAELRRAGRWLRCEIALRRSVDAERVRCRLFRGGRLVARAAGDVTERRAVVRLEAAGRLAAGSYTLVVTAIHADGSASSERRRVTIR